MILSSSPGGMPEEEDFFMFLRLMDGGCESVYPQEVPDFCFSLLYCGIFCISFGKSQG